MIPLYSSPFLDHHRVCVRLAGSVPDIHERLWDAEDPGAFCDHLVESAQWRLTLDGHSRRDQAGLGVLNAFRHLRIDHPLVLADEAKLLLVLIPEMSVAT